MQSLEFLSLRFTAYSLCQHNRTQKMGVEEPGNLLGEVPELHRAHATLEKLGQLVEASNGR